MTKARDLYLPPEEILWKDRKRVFGLPISFTVYTLTRERLTINRGLIKTMTDEIMVYRIMDNRLRRTLFQKICKVGTVVLLSNDKSCPKLELKNIQLPDKVRRFLSNLIEEQRDKRGIVSSEFLINR